MCGGDLHGQRVAAGGGLVGDPVIISDEPHTQANPAVAVAHTAADPSFLVVWEDYRAASNAGIYGQRLDQDGQKKERHIGLTPLDGIQTRPAVAYSEISDRYLVVWEQQEEGGSLIMVYTLDGGGRLVSWPAILSTVTIATDPAVAWDSANDRFLVVWRDVGQTTGIDIRGQLVAPNGSLLGGNLVVSDAPGEQRAPAVASAGSLGRYLEVFEDLRDDDGSGESVDAHGHVLDSGGAPLFARSAGNFQVATPTGVGRREARPVGPRGPGRPPGCQHRLSRGTRRRVGS